MGMYRKPVRKKKSAKVFRDNVAHTKAVNIITRGGKRM